MTIEAAVSDIDLCPCRTVNDPGHTDPYDGKDVLLEIITGDVNGLFTLTWMEGSDPGNPIGFDGWFNLTAATARFTVFDSGDAGCGGDVFYTEDAPVWVYVLCACITPGEVNPNIIARFSDGPSTVDWSIFVNDATGGCGDFDDTFSNINACAGGNYVGGENGTLTLAEV